MRGSILLAAGFLMLLVTGCKKTADGPCFPENNETAKWELVAYLADPGDGSGNWMEVNPVNRKTLVLEGNGKVGGDFDPDLIKYMLTDHKMIHFYYNDGREKELQYRFEDADLILEGGCIEACGSRFERID